MECKCTNSECVVQIIDDELMEKLVKLRELCGKSIVVTSGYRCEAHNKKIGGHPNSSHIKGLAADLVCAGMNIKDFNALVEKVFNNIGIANSFTHVDVREGGPRRWKY